MDASHGTVTKSRTRASLVCTSSNIGTNMGTSSTHALHAVKPRKRVCVHRQSASNSLSPCVRGVCARARACCVCTKLCAVLCVYQVVCRGGGSNIHCVMRWVCTGGENHPTEIAVLQRRGTGKWHTHTADGHNHTAQA